MNAYYISTLFKNDLWKDQRTLKTIDTEEGKAIIKQYPSDLEKQIEISVSEFLNNCGITGIPHITSYDVLASKMPYHEGIRLFNLFVALDSVRIETKGISVQIKKDLIERCEERQRAIQNALIQWREKQVTRTPYPQSKMLSIIDILSFCLKIRINKEELFDEISRISEYFSSVSTIPFRDSTPKNMILCYPALFAERFQSDNERNDYICQCIQNNSYHQWIDAPIVDIDFSSCIHDTTFEDDVISLKFHERTWNGVLPEAKDLIWNSTPDTKRAAISFLVRYFRFGGRKAAYRLLHPIGHRVRFKYDNDCFYFTNLLPFLEHLWPDYKNEYPNLSFFIAAVARNLPFQSEVLDTFLEYFPNIDMSRNYYSDVFPY